MNRYKVTLKFVQYAEVIVEADHWISARHEAKGMGMMQDDRIDWNPLIDPGDLQFDEVELVELIEENIE